MSQKVRDPGLLHATISPDMSTMTAEVETPVVPDFVLGETYRILRILHPTMLTVYDRELPAAIRDFYRRSGPRVDGRRTPIPGTSAEAIEQAIRAVPLSDHAALWLGLTASYRLLGFLVAEVGRDLWGPMTVFVLGAYLWPKRPNRALFPAFAETASAWGRSRGATVLASASWRGTPAFWRRRLGYTAGARIYVKEIAG